MSGWKRLIPWAPEATLFRRLTFGPNPLSLGHVVASLLSPAQPLG